MTSRFTCITCRVAFTDADIQRQHYKTDWHRYNLKRKVAELPPISAEGFQRRVLLQREQNEAEGKQDSAFCKVCRKMFNSSKSLENHLKSKKHLTLTDHLLLGSDCIEPVVSSASGSGSNSTVSNIESASKDQGSSDLEDDSDVEEIDSDEWDEQISENNPILRNNCLFCSNHSRTMTKNLKHMTLAHSFFIPDIEYLTDVKGLLCYLGEKLVQGYMCLWCNDRGRAFHSAEAAQQHMIDKGHCKMLHEGEALLEYSDYYNYSTSYPDYSLNKDSDDGEEDEFIMPEACIEDEDFQLRLPSGHVIGHRSLMRYYRQNLNPVQVVVPVNKKVNKVIAQYRALGWTAANSQAISKKVKDLKFMKRVQSKYYMKLGVKANSLCVKRPQVNF